MPEPIRVAVIDSGIQPQHPHIDAGRLRPGIGILADGTLLAGAEETLDQLGHGTAVAAAIQEKAPDALLLPARVFREGLRASPRALATAIRWSIEQRADLINLSLGSMNPAHAVVFAALADEAAEAGCVIIAAFEAGGEPCWPGCLPQVIGVGLDWDVPRETCRVSTTGSGAAIHASGYPRPIPGVPPRRNLYGVSFAVAQVTGLAAACATAPMTRAGILSIIGAE